jgi:hypothetical protein
MWSAVEKFKRDVCAYIPQAAVAHSEGTLAGHHRKILLGQSKIQSAEQRFTAFIRSAGKIRGRTGTQSRLPWIPRPYRLDRSICRQLALSTSMVELALFPGQCDVRRRHSLLAMHSYTLKSLTERKSPKVFTFAHN